MKILYFEKLNFDFENKPNQSTWPWRLLQTGNQWLKPRWLAEAAGTIDDYICQHHADPAWTTRCNLCLTLTAAGWTLNCVATIWMDIALDCTHLQLDGQSRGLEESERVSAGGAAGSIRCKMAWAFIYLQLNSIDWCWQRIVIGKWKAFILTKTHSLKLSIDFQKIDLID